MAAPFVEPRFAVLYGTGSGIFLAAAFELLLEPFIYKDEAGSYLWLAGVLFLVSAVTSGLIAWELQSFGSHLASKGAVDSSIADKIDIINKKEWGRLKRSWLYLLISVGCLILGIELFIFTIFLSES